MSNYYYHPRNRTYFNFNFETWRGKESCLKLVRLAHSMNNETDFKVLMLESVTTLTINCSHAWPRGRACMQLSDSPMFHRPAWQLLSQRVSFRFDNYSLLQAIVGTMRSIGAAFLWIGNKLHSKHDVHPILISRLQYDFTVAAACYGF